MTTQQSVREKITRNFIAATRLSQIEEMVKQYDAMPSIFRDELMQAAKQSNPVVGASTPELLRGARNDGLFYLLGRVDNWHQNLETLKFFREPPLLCESFYWMLLHSRSTLEIS